MLYQILLHAIKNYTDWKLYINNIFSTSSISYQYLNIKQNLMNLLRVFTQVPSYRLILSLRAQWQQKRNKEQNKSYPLRNNFHPKT